MHGVRVYYVWCAPRLQGGLCEAYSTHLSGASITEQHGLPAGGAEPYSRVAGFLPHCTLSCAVHHWTLLCPWLVPLGSALPDLKSATCSHLLLAEIKWLFEPLYYAATISLL